MSMIANIIKAQIIHKMKYDLKIHPMSYKITFMSFSNHSSTFIY